MSEEVASLSEYSSALGRPFRALKLWAVLRCYGRGLLPHPRGDPPRGALRVACATSRAGRWWRRGPSRSSASGATAATRRTRRCSSGQRERRDLPLAHATERALRASARGRQRAHDRGRRPARLGGARRKRLVGGPRRERRAGARASPSRPRSGRPRTADSRSGDRGRSRPSRRRRRRPRRSGVAIPSTSEASSFPTRNEIVPCGEIGERARSSASINQPSSSASTGGGPIRRAPKRASSCSTASRARSSSARRRSRRRGGSFFFSTRPAASSSRSRAARMLVPIFAGPSTRSVYRFGPCISSRTTSSVQRSPTRLSAQAIGQYWS